MKTIGLLFGIDTKFPLDVLACINDRSTGDFNAQELKIGILRSNESPDFSVIFDRISDHVPFYKSFLRWAKKNGTMVVTNSFSSCSDDDFNHISIASQLGIKTPKTALLPSKWLPKNLSPESMRNLIFPLNWDDMFDYVGFPAYLKSNTACGVLHDYKVYNKSEFYSAYELTGANLMILQEALNYSEYYRTFVIGKKYVRIVKYAPTKPLHLRYSHEEHGLSQKIVEKITKIAIQISKKLDYDYNAIEFAIVGDDLYAVEFKNSIPQIERHILYDDTYDWLVNQTSDYLIELCSDI